MKQPENNEIDSLLRAWAGHQRSDPSGLAGNDADLHLDADELNSYAEGALPPRARARYSSHLIDCDHCRKLVAQLALAAGPILKEPATSQESSTSGWRRTLAAFLAPSVLRYALPALVVVFVGIVFVASRRQNENRSVAETTQSEPKPAGQSTNQAYDDAQGLVAKAPPEQTKAASPQPSRAPVTAGKAGEQDRGTADAPPPPATLAEKQSAASASDKAAAASEKKEASTRSEAEAAAQSAYAKEPPPPPAKPASAVQPKDANAAVGGLADRRDAAARKRENESASASGATTGSARSSAGRDEDRQKNKSLDGVNADSSDEESETRSVAGRRFQRRNRAWVDSAYKSSMAVTRVARGSEQYRALIADEPEIGAITKQLSGEVIIVWKGRAYHIR